MILILGIIFLVLVLAVSGDRGAKSLLTLVANAVALSVLILLINKGAHPALAFFMITSGVNLILIDAASASALAGVVERAQQAGIQVVSFDNAVESEYNIIVNTKADEFGRIGGEWLAKKLASGDETL